MQCFQFEGAHVELFNWLLSKGMFQNCDLHLSVGSWRLLLAVGVLTAVRDDFLPLQMPCGIPEVSRQAMAALTDCHQTVSLKQTRAE